MKIGKLFGFVRIYVRYRTQCVNQVLKMACKCLEIKGVIFLAQALPLPNQTTIKN